MKQDSNYLKRLYLIHCIGVCLFILGMIIGTITLLKIISGVAIFGYIIMIICQFLVWIEWKKGNMEYIHTSIPAFGFH